MSRRPGLVITPWDVALRMMRNGRDAGLVAAYLEEEARRAGIDPFDLSMHPSDCVARAMRRASEHMRDLVAPLWRIVAAAARLQQAVTRADFTLAGPP